LSQLGIIVGLASEARLAAGLGHVFCSAARPDQARTGALQLIAQGCDAILSFGIGGGLDPELSPGSLVIAEAVICPDGGLHATDRPWRDRLYSSLAPLEPIIGVVAGSDQALSGPAAKHLLRQKTGAILVDMESQAVAKAAAAHGLPFMVLRAIADPAMRGLPQSALVGLDEAGNPRIGAVLAKLLSRPWELPALIRLGLDSRAAHAQLREALKLSDLSYPSHPSIRPFGPTQDEVNI
jgi:adenosylhomocysteine nucleosidase